jgi:hypothetical protein
LATPECDSLSFDTAKTHCAKLTWLKSERNHPFNPELVSGHPVFLSYARFYCIVEVLCSVSLQEKIWDGFSFGL